MAHGGDFRYASDLVRFIRQRYGDAFTLEVAAYPEMHPQAANFDADVDNFVTKAEAGADRAITQYFFNADAYRHFLGEVRRRGCDIEVVPGIMPITNVSSLIRFSDACGADIPRWLRKQLEACGDDSQRIQAIGLDVVTTLCRELLDAGAPGLHFYTLNRSQTPLAILDRPRLKRADQAPQASQRTAWHTAFLSTANTAPPACKFSNASRRTPRSNCSASPKISAAIRHCASAI